MSNYNEVLLGFEWLYSVLSGDATLTSLAPGGVWRSMAPPSSLMPYVIMALQAGSDVTAMNGFRIMDDLLMQIKVVGPASNTATIASAAAQIDRLLGGPPLQPASGTIAAGPTTIAQVYACYRQTPLVIDELINGELFLNVGGLYRMEIQQIAS